MIAEGDIVGVSNHVQRHSPGRSRRHTADRQTFLSRACLLAPFGRWQARGALGGKGRPWDDATGGSYHLASLIF
jgi:hypothetical protein